MHYLIEHETVLEYTSPVKEHHVELRLAPREDPCHHLISRRVETDPESSLKSYTDYYGNRVEYFCVIQPHTRLVTRVISEVETLRNNPFDYTPIAMEEQQEWLKKTLRAEPHLNDYLLHRSSVTPSAEKLIEAVDGPLPRQEKGVPLLDALQELMKWVSQVLEYRSGTTSVHADLLETIRQRGGVCQDFAHLFITVARFWGIPARYVMGYLDPGVGILQGDVATHAWAEVLIPGGGWIGFDATHNLLANDFYVPVAVGRDSYDAAPQRGSYKGDDPGSQPQVKLSMVQLDKGQKDQNQIQSQVQSQKVKSTPKSNGKKNKNQQ
jgi:transglutaminase-like putative cysteine protease